MVPRIINSSNSDPGGRTVVGSPSPLPTTVRALHAYRKYSGPLSSLSFPFLTWSSLSSGERPSGRAGVKIRVW